MRRRLVVLLAALAVPASSARVALAAAPPDAASSSAPAPASSSASAAAVSPLSLAPDRGLAVLAESAPGDDLPAAPGALGDTPAWKLARAIYADASLRPSFDEARARALAGGPPAVDAPTDVRDLAETRAAIHGEGGASRRLLASLASQLHVRGIVVVSSPARAHVFLASTGQFDAATYAPDASGEWSGAASSLGRTYGTGAGVNAALGSTVTPAGALFAVPASNPAAAAEGDGKHRAFYLSPWFWGAVGAAALGGVAVYFATKDSDSSTIHLQLQVPALK